MYVPMWISHIDVHTLDHVLLCSMILYHWKLWSMIFLIDWHFSKYHIAYQLS